MIYFDVYCAIAALVLAIGVRVNPEDTKKLINEYERAVFVHGAFLPTLIVVVVTAMVAMTWPVHLVASLIRGRRK